MEEVYFAVDDVTVTFYERLGDALNAAGLNKNSCVNESMRTVGGLLFQRVACPTGLTVSVHSLTVRTLKRFAKR